MPLLRSPPTGNPFDGPGTLWGRGAYPSRPRAFGRPADIGATPGFVGDLEAALGAIEAKAIVMPGGTDLYFPPEDNEYEVGLMPDAELRPIPSIWGHLAGSGRNPEDVRFIDGAIKELLAA